VSADVKEISSASISWITSAQEEFGTFFVNKPNFGWDPADK